MLCIAVISRTFITTKQVSPVIDPVLPVDGLICHCVYVVPQLYTCSVLIKLLVVSYKDCELRYNRTIFLYHSIKPHCTKNLMLSCCFLHPPNPTFTLSYFRYM